MAQGPYLGVPGQKPLIFTSRMAKSPDLGPGPLVGPIPLYIGEIALFGPWGPGPGARFLYVHSGEIEKRPTFAVVATT